MWRARRQRIAAALVLVVVGTAGVLAFAQWPNEGAASAPIPVQPGDVIPALRPGMSPLEARIATAREIVNQDMERLRVGLGSGIDVLGEIPTWSRRLMDDRLRLAATPKDRLDAIREHRNRMLYYERLTDNYARAGQSRVSDALKGRYYRLEADQLLTDAGGNPSKEPPIAEPKRDGAPPPPAPPSPPPPAPR